MGNVADACRVERRREEWEQQNGILKPTITTKMRERKKTEKLKTAEELSDEKVTPQAVALVDALKARHGVMASSSDSGSNHAWTDEDDEEGRGLRSHTNTLLSEQTGKGRTESGGWDIAEHSPANDLRVAPPPHPPMRQQQRAPPRPEPSGGRDEAYRARTTSSVASVARTSSDADSSEWGAQAASGSDSREDLSRRDGRRGSIESLGGQSFASMWSTPAHTAARHSPWPRGWLEYTILTDSYTNVGGPATRVGYFAVLEDYAFTSTMEDTSTWMQTWTASVKQNEVSTPGLSLVCFAEPDAVDEKDHLLFWSLTGAYVTADDDQNSAFVVCGEPSGPRAKGVGVKLQHGVPSVRKAWVSGLRSAQAYRITQWNVTAAAEWLANSVRAANIAKNASVNKGLSKAVHPPSNNSLGHWSALYWNSVLF